MNAQTRQAGYSALELILVIVVIGIISAVALPRMLNRTSFDEWGYHDQVVAALQYARKSAVASRRQVCVTLGSGGLALTRPLSAPEASPSCSGAPAFALPDRSTNQLPLPQGVSLSPAALSFQFDALGRPLSGGATSTFIVQIAGQPDITIERETGFVR